MGFSADRQTLDDLNITGKFNNRSIFSLFNRVATRGGERLLESMFALPLSEEEKINRRADEFGFFISSKEEFPLDAALLEKAEKYLANPGSKRLIGSYIENFRRKALKSAGSEKEYEIIKEGISATAEILVRMKSFAARIGKNDGADIYCDKLNEIRNITDAKGLDWKDSIDDNIILSLGRVSYYDCQLRGIHRENIQRLLSLIYEIDVNISVAKVALERGFVKPRVLSYDTSVLKIDGFYHPQISGAVANDILIDHKMNVFFLTGANMAGKSTLMKSVGIAVYLAHMGFPVAAKNMEFSVLDGMFSSINVSDNLNLGYSHFYAEVLRVKKVAQSVSELKNLLVIFDELFKGTNVKDAYDATVTVTEAFSRHHNCMFIISTHITEAGDTLRERCCNMQFRYMPTIMTGSRPSYPYLLTEGITADRHGMMIIDNENILESIRARS